MISTRSPVLPGWSRPRRAAVASRITEGFDGVMLGQPGAPYHLEFTRAHGHVAGAAPTADNLLVFYLPDDGAWNDAVARMKRAAMSRCHPSTPIGIETG